MLDDVVRSASPPQLKGTDEVARRHVQQVLNLPRTFLRLDDPPVELAAISRLSGDLRQDNLGKSIVAPNMVPSGNVQGQFQPRIGLLIVLLTHFVKRLANVEGRRLDGVIVLREEPRSKAAQQVRKGLPVLPAGGKVKAITVFRSTQNRLIQRVG